MARSAYLVKLKWIMKQYWRVGTIRALLSLALSMFVLGRLYYVYVPGLENLGVIGAIILGSSLVLLFIGLGWYYDEKMKMWSQSLQANTERHPYQYIPDFKTYTFDYPVYYAILVTMNKILEKLGHEIDSAKSILPYMKKYFSRKPTRGDIFSALPYSYEYMKQHPIGEEFKEEKTKIGLRNRAKLGFQVNMLRLTWIQALTGLFQDVLVFGTFYIVLFATGSSGVSTVVSMDILILGVVFISIPLFIFLAFLGWLYDRRFKVWSPDVIVKVERNPYTYLAEPRMYVFVFPFLIAIFSTLQSLLKKANLETDTIDEILGYLSEYSKLDLSEDENMERSKELRKKIGDLFITEESI